jgi:hypothetical protein
MFNMCLELARPQQTPHEQSSLSFVAANGTIIEQPLIVTTHNLAVLVGELGVVGFEREEGGGKGLPLECMRVVCRYTRAAQVAWQWRDMAANAKRAVFAWRRLVFFVALSSEDAAGGMHAVGELKHVAGGETWEV